MNVHMVKLAMNSSPISRSFGSFEPVLRRLLMIGAQSCRRPLNHSLLHHPQVEQRKHHQLLVGVLEFKLACELADKFESGGGKADLFHLNLTHDALSWVTFEDIH